MTAALILIIPTLCAGIPDFVQFHQGFSSTPLPDNGPGEQISLVGFISAVIIRLFGVGATVFVIHILVQFARYQSRIAAHLETVADALCLAGEKIDTLPGLVAALELKNVDFGKDPRIPLPSVVALLKKELGISK
jgi:hypothetical protein